jgi:hypothetical protein
MAQAMRLAARAEVIASQAEQSCAHVDPTYPYSPTSARSPQSGGT